MKLSTFLVAGAFAATAASQKVKISASTFSTKYVLKLILQ